MKININSWHYKIYKWTYDNPPKTVCEYFGLVLYNIIAAIIALAFIGILISILGYGTYVLIFIDKDIMTESDKGFAFVSLLTFWVGFWWAYIDGRVGDWIFTKLNIKCAEIELVDYKDDGRSGCL
jgi:hypothetical protein